MKWFYITKNSNLRTHNYRSTKIEWSTLITLLWFPVWQCRIVTRSCNHGLHVVLWDEGIRHLRLTPTDGTKFLLPCWLFVGLVALELVSQTHVVTLTVNCERGEKAKARDERLDGTLRVDCTDRGKMWGVNITYSRRLVWKTKQLKCSQS